MNFKKWWALSACLTLCFMLISLLLPVRASADSYYDNDGFLVLQSNNFPSNYPYYDIYSSPVIDNTVSIPSGYHLIGYNADVGYSSLSYPTTVEWYYANTSADITAFFNGGNLYVDSSVGNLYYIRNRCSSSGELSFNRASYASGFSSGRLNKFTFFVPIFDENGNVHLPEGQVNFTLNTAIFGYNLAFNSQINSGDATSVDYYIFPASAPISSGSSSSVVSSTPVTELTQSQRDNLLFRGFDWIFGHIDELITSISSPEVSLSTTSSSRSSGRFVPASYGLSYEKIGVGHLFPSSGGAVSTSGSLSLKDMLSYHTGVYANSALKLVAVVNTDSTSFIATFDFNPSAIVGGSPVPPSTLEGKAPYPDFQHPDSDFKDLADYLKGLFDINNDNSIRNNNNLLANLMAIPWSNFIGTGFANGFANVMPELSFSLDSLFDSLFDKYSAPSTEQINSLIADVTEERSYIRQKLAFVSDVKQEVFFIQSTFVSAGDNPRPFTVTLPDFMMGNKVHGHQEALVRYDLISENTRQAMHNVIIVFCSLAVVMHIWHTLPATVGNMPRE